MSKLSDDRIRDFINRAKPVMESLRALTDEYPEFSRINVYTEKKDNFVDISARCESEEEVEHISYCFYDEQPEDCVGNIHRYDSEWKNGVVVK